MKKNIFSLTPIGGVDEIGSNMTLIEGEKEDFIIDCGMLFPYEECFDINFLVPNFSTLDKDKIKSVIITHGHEDHIGGLGMFLKEFPHVTVYVTEFTLHLIQKKLIEFGVKFAYQVIKPGQTLALGDWEITPAHVNHSIPETTGLVICTKDKSWGLLYISDFKVDLTAKHELPIDFELIKNKLSACSHTAYFIDSTNITFEGKTTSENELEADLDHLVNRPERKVFVTLFASNIHRINLIAQKAIAAGRKIVVMGRSVGTYLEAARETGHTFLNEDDLLTPEQGARHTGKQLIFVSGCQGDFLSALRRFSYGEDGHYKPSSGDLVVFSSKVIPGNEKKISRIYNKLARFGTEIITASDYLIHASGHPGQEDIKLLLQNFTPQYYFPIHGETYMLNKHREFISKTLEKTKVNVIHNFTTVHFAENDISIEENSPLDPTIVHGKNIEIERSQISQRRKMATQGTLFISYNRATGEIQISQLGLPLIVAQYMEQLNKRLLKQIHDDLKNRADDYFRDQLKISARQFLNNLLGYKPVTEVHLF